MNLTITSIASSSAGNCYLLDNGSSRLMIECGITWKRIQQATGYTTSTLAGCLVTHGHADHSRGVKDAIKNGVDVYLSSGTLGELRLADPSEANKPFNHHRIHIVSTRRQFSIRGDWNVMPFDVVHDAEEPLGFLISTGPYKILFLTDLSYCRYKFKGVTHLMVEANFCERILAENIRSGLVDPARRKRLVDSHMSIQRVIDLLHKMDGSSLQEIHLIHLSEQNSDEEWFKRFVARYTGKPVYICQA